VRAAAVLIVALMAALMAAGETDPRASAAAAAAAAIHTDSPSDHFVPTQVSSTVLTVAVHSAEIQNLYCSWTGPFAATMC